MLHQIREGETLDSIAQRYQITTEQIMEANILCRPDVLSPGHLLIIPDPEIPLPEAGGTPYYIVQPGDDLACISEQFQANIETLMNINQIDDPDQLEAGQQMSIGPGKPDPQVLKNRWEQMNGQSCEELSPLTIHGLYYLETYTWADIGEESIPYLSQLAQHPCDTVRLYAVISMGRIASDQPELLQVLQRHIDENDQAFIVQTAQIALQRIPLVQQWGKRVHMTLFSLPFFHDANLQSPSVQLPPGTVLYSQQWYIPSPTGEEGPRGGPQIYDYMHVQEVGTGFLPRIGFNQLGVI